VSVITQNRKNAMKIVQMFKTADGKTFDDRNKARQHEVDLEANEKLWNLLKVSFNTGRPEAVMRHILMENAEMSAILATYRKKSPKDASKENVVSMPKATQAAVKVA